MNEDNIIIWSKLSSLKWADFKAEPNSGSFEDAHSTIKYRYTWTVNSEKMGSQILFLIENLQVNVEFHSVLSWVRTSQSNDQLLNHEQGHFDLAELVRRENEKKLQTKFYGKHYPTRGQNEEQRKQFAKDDSGKMIAAEIETLEQYLSQRREIYDTETNYGQNLDKQKQYDVIFDKLRL